MSYEFYFITFQHGVRSPTAVLQRSQNLIQPILITFETKYTFIASGYLIIAEGGQL